MYRIRLMTTEEMTVELESQERASQMAGNLIALRKAHHHHGETITAEVYPVVEEKSD